MQSNLFYNLTSIPEFRNIVKNYLKNRIVENCKSINISEVNDNYKIISYDKNYLALDLIPTHGLLRSVILNKENKVVSFAPPKSLHSDTFIKKYNDTADDIIAEEFVEGTMINIFWDPCIGLGGSWEIATRNEVGANSRFYKNNSGKTFRQMFIECCQRAGLDYEILEKKFCYTFVIQHPESRIVLPVSRPEIYLVQVCEIVCTENGSVNVFIEDINNIKNSSTWSSNSVKFPKIYDNWKKYSDLIDEYASMNTSYDILGVIIRNKKTNERCKIKNPVYEIVCQLRGNKPKLQYQYLSLRKDGKVKKFLEIYPAYKKEFSSFRDQVHLFTNTIFQNYLSCYIRKDKLLSDFPHQFRGHMSIIHQMYISELKEKNLCVTNRVVIDYVNSMNSSKLMFLLNYSMRKRVVDFVKADLLS